HRACASRRRTPFGQLMFSMNASVAKSTPASCAVMASRRFTAPPSLPPATLVQLFRHRLELMALDEDHLGHRVAILEARHHTHHPVALVLFGGLIGRRPKRAL